MTCCLFLHKMDRLLAKLANLNGCQIIMIDGSQAWKHPRNGHAYQRDRGCKLNTPAKIGLLLHVSYYSYPINILCNIFP